MNIGIDASRLAVGKRTGTENYSWQVTRGLINLATDQHFTLYFNQNPSAELSEEFGSNHAVDLRTIPFPRLWTHFRLSREMLQQPPDVLFVPAHVLPAYHPSRSVVTIHDLGYLYYPEAHTRQSLLYLDYSTRFSASAASGVIAISHATRQDLIRHYGINPAKIKVIYHGLDHSRFHPVTDAAQIQAVRQRYQLADGPYLLFVGTVQPRKNLVRLLDAFAALVQDNQFADLQLVIGGKPGWLREPIMQHVQKLKLGERVKFAGYVTDEDLPVLLSGAEIFVLPSLYEGFGMPLVEAMACATPVVCSNAGSLPEVAGEAALLHNPLDTQAIAWNLRQLLTSNSLKEELTGRGLQHAASFTWERCAAETLEFLTQC